ncbi:hypothetical protein P8C59_003346 [Phyllachora maydis]|uniref:Mannosyltransferase n=1 Tax=Phyllachora maydis TaxID=1825666 RepID=A0AAD9MCB4_9PEZI|nr:hypothetical protein P8C59_003346 [Phyllachora maydis]
MKSPPPHKVDVVLALLLPALVLVHLAVAPHTKVEESFNMQAAHDVLVYGTPTADVANRLSATYDHFAFPGAVPRTFIGAVLLAGISQPVIVAALGFDRAQLVVRAVLGLFNAACLLVFARSLRRAAGPAAARFYLLLQASQFHILFYASRTLPNMFAFGLTTLASAFLLPPPPRPSLPAPSQRLSVALLVFAAIIFRAEVALLLATHCLYLLFLADTTIPRLLPPFMVSVVVALAISVPVDSYFWQKPLWPELWGFYYNALLGSSSNWGVSPWHYYFTSALPRLLLNPFALLVLIPLSLRHPATAPLAARMVVPNLLFLAIYSLQPHKEARFVFYVVPPLTAAAALGANIVFTRRNKSTRSAMLTAVLVMTVLASFAISTAMLLLSALNYPGGEAMAYLRDLVRSTAGATASVSTVVTVHADVLACMTGATLFSTAMGHTVPDPRATNMDRPGLSNALVSSRDSTSVVLALDKTEDDPRLTTEAFWTRFDYVLVEDAAVVKGGRWDELALVKSFSGLEVMTPRTVAVPETGTKVVGHGALVGAWKDMVRKATGGWWVGPRMVPRLRILARRKDAERATRAVNS